MDICDNDAISVLISVYVGLPIKLPSWHSRSVHRDPRNVGTGIERYFLLGYAPSIARPQLEDPRMLRASKVSRMVVLQQAEACT